MFVPCHRLLISPCVVQCLQIRFHATCQHRHVLFVRTHPSSSRQRPHRLVCVCCNFFHGCEAVSSLRIPSQLCWFEAQSKCLLYCRSKLFSTPGTLNNDCSRGPFLASPNIRPWVIMLVHDLIHWSRGGTLAGIRRCLALSSHSHLVYACRSHHQAILVAHTSRCVTMDPQAS